MIRYVTTLSMMLMAGYLLLLPGMTLAAPVPLPKTGQISIYAASDDGDRQTGVAWPTPRFSDLGDGTVADGLTGLIWAKNAGTPTVGVCAGGRKGWQEALGYVDCLNRNAYLGHTDWILPNINELRSLVDVENSQPALPDNHPFSNVDMFIYWSSTTVAHATASAWNVYMEVGNVSTYYKTAPFNVWPVREMRSSSATINLIKTGQTVSYASGDDGARQRGVAWPSPRFVDKGDGTVTDLLTGLIWTKRADCFPLQSWEPAIRIVNTLASGACGLNDGSRPGDWRLPNREELISLIDRSRTYPSLPSGHPFAGIQTFYYWTSNTYDSNPNLAWGVYVNYGGYVSDRVKSSSSGDGYVWAVRSGLVPVTDADADTIPDSADNCPNIANTDQADFDKDMIGDACDADDDNDGVMDVSDAFPLNSAEWADNDGDGIGNNADNCPNIANTGQADFDKDMSGNVCDADDDNDGVMDVSDAFPLNPAEWTDSDGDGNGDNADPVVVAATPGKIITPTKSTTGTVKVSWAASTTAGATYVVERSSDRGKTWSHEPQYTVNANTFVYVTALPNGSYMWRVKAVHKGYVDSLWSIGRKVMVKKNKR